MRRGFKNLTVVLWIAAVAAMVGLVALQMVNRDRQTALAGTPPPNDATAGTPAILAINAPDFALTDQQNKTITTGDLKGHPWVADFIFTECTSACPIMTRRMSAMQKQISPAVKFVSFDVDPDHDTPAVLLAYAKENGADNDRWHFLTGEKPRLYAAISGMKVSIVQPVSGNQIEHDIHFILIDGEGRFRGVYDSRTQADLDRLVHDANALTAENGS